jgi:hypothetical protein
MKDERAIARSEQQPREEHDARDAVTPKGQMTAEIDGDDGGASRRAGVIAGIGEARQPFEQDLELEEQLFFVVEREPLEPRFARLLLFAMQAARLVQNVRIAVVAWSAAPLLRERYVRTSGGAHHPKSENIMPWPAGSPSGRGHFSHSHFAGRERGEVGSSGGASRRDDTGHQRPHDGAVMRDRPRPASAQKG